MTVFRSSEWRKKQLAYINTTGSGLIKLEIFKVCHLKAEHGKNKKWEQSEMAKLFFISLIGIQFFHWNSKSSQHTQNREGQLPSWVEKRMV
jgi:hypothetical protein